MEVMGSNRLLLWFTTVSSVLVPLYAFFGLGILPVAKDKAVSLGTRPLWRDHDGLGNDTHSIALSRNDPALIKGFL
jgi:hypothetical protein